MTLEEKRKYRRDYMREYYRSNADYRRRHTAVMREYYVNHRDAIKVTTKLWLQKNKIKVREARKQWAVKNQEKMLRARRKWVLKNPDKVRAIEKRYWERNPEKLTLKRRIVWQRRRARMALCKSDGTADTFIKFIRNKTKVACYYCGKSVSGKEAHIDHIIAVSRHGNHASDNLCACCPTCNQKKRDRSPGEWIKSGQLIFSI